MPKTSVYAGQVIQVRTQMEPNAWRIAYAMRSGGDMETDGIEVLVLDPEAGIHHRSGVLHETNAKWNDQDWIEGTYNAVQLKIGIGGQWRACPNPELEALRDEVAELRRQIENAKSKGRKEAALA